MLTERLEEIPGVPESELRDALPDRAPPAPWTLVADAIAWVHRATPEALEQVPAAARTKRHVPVTVGAFVRYHDGPVGPYSEVFASPVLLLPRGVPALTVPFMAVDSLASVRGGRANWSLPKTLAEFVWASGTEATGRGPGWTVTARARTSGPAFPTASAGLVRQATPDGGRWHTSMRTTAKARVARVTVTAQGPTLDAWLRDGTHLGAVLTGATLRFPPPRPV